MSALPREAGAEAHSQQPEAQAQTRSNVAKTSHHDTIVHIIMNVVTDLLYTPVCSENFMIGMRFGLLLVP